MTEPLIEKIHFHQLIELARARFDTNLLVIEAQVIQHSVRSDDFEPQTDSDPKPNIRPKFLRWLATDAEAAALIDPKGIRVFSATLSGRLDLHGCHITHMLKFVECHFKEDICLATADVPALYLIGGQISKGVLADGIIVRGPLFIKNLKSSGAIRLIGARIDRNFDCSGTVLDVADPSLILDGARILGSVFLHEGFKSSGEIRMLNARIGGDFGCDGAQLTATANALSLDKVIVEGGMSLSSGFQSSGSIRIPGCQIFGDLDCAGAHLTAGGIALNLATADIRGHLYLRSDFRGDVRRDFKSSGQICLHSARIGNSLDCSGATLTGAVTSILLEEATVVGSVALCDGFNSFGRVELQGAHVGGNLVCDGATLLALYCANIKLDGDLIWTNIQNPKKTSLWLNGASIKNIRDDRESWPDPGGLHLDGLAYRELTLHSARTPDDRQKNSYGREHEIKIVDRIEWLSLQPPIDRTEPQPWMQLAELLKAKGDNAGAKRIIFEMRRYESLSRWFVPRWSSILFARLEEQPLRILIPILFLTLLGSCIFKYAESQGSIAPTSNEAYVAWSKGSLYNVAYPRFNPLIYSLENGLPLVKLGQDDKWAPDPGHRSASWIASYTFLSWFRWFLILAGWAQATILASAIGSRFKP
jgi:hypothetical protein